jgi:hypothetical protein
MRLRLSGIWTDWRFCGQIGHISARRDATQVRAMVHTTVRLLAERFRSVNEGTRRMPCTEVDDDPLVAS